MEYSLLTDDEIVIARTARHYRLDLKMRWCSIERIYGLEQEEIQRLICLLTQMESEGFDSFSV